MPHLRYTPIAFVLATIFSAHTVATEIQTANKNRQDDIVISASRVESKRIESGSSITVLDAQYLKENQSRTVAEVLQDVPGVNVVSNGGLGQITSVIIRGADSNKTLVIIDGIEVNDLSSISSGYNFAHLTADNIERIEVLRGSQSALWGSDAMGGVINIVTKKGKAGFNPTANIEIGENNYHKESVNLSGVQGNSQYSLSAHHLESEGISAKTRKLDDPDTDGYKNKNITLQAGHQVTSIFAIDGVMHYSEAKTEYDEDKYEFNMNTFESEQVENFVAIYSKARQRLAKLNTYLNLLDNRWKNRLSVAFSDSKNEDLSSYSSEYKGQKIKTDLQTDYYLNTVNEYAQRISFIAEHENERYQSWAMDEKQRIEASGIILGYGADWAKTVFVNAAVRHDFNDTFADTSTYHIDLSAWVSDGNRIHASHGSGVKNPTLGQLYGEVTAWSYSGNANLTPEESRSWDTGVEYNFADLDAYIDLTYFDTFYTEMITWETDSSTYESTYINLDDKATARGVELTGSMKINDAFRASAGYTYMKTDDGEGNELARRPKHSASINANYKYTEKLSANIGARYVGERIDSDDSTLGSYTVINIAAAYQVHKRITLSARLENAFDEDYEEIRDYGTDPLTAYLGITFK